MANEFVQTMDDARVDAKSLSEFIFKPANFMVSRRLASPVNTLQHYIDMFENISIGGEFNSAKIESLTVITGAAGTDATVVTGGTPSARTFALTIPRGDKGDKGDKGADGSFSQKAYTTEALMIADKENIPANTSVEVSNDPITDKNGKYAYNGSIFTKSAYDPLTLAKAADLLVEQRIRNQTYASVTLSSIFAYHADLNANTAKMANGAVVYDSATKIMYIPDDTVIYKPTGGFASIQGKVKVDLSAVLASTSLARVYCNINTLAFTVEKGITSITEAQQKDWVLFCSVRDRNVTGDGAGIISIDGTFRYYVDMSAYGEPIYNERPNIIMGDPTEAIHTAKTINYSTTAKTLTIPFDTLISYKNSIFSTATEVVIDASIATSAKKIYYNLETNTFYVTAWNTVLSRELRYKSLLLCAIRDRGFGDAYIDITAPYSINGNPYGITSSGGSVSGVTQNRLDDSVKGIAHRGYSTEAPENTLPSYQLAKKMGFSYVETDVLFTADDVPVLLHDSTIDRTSNGTGAINTLTLAQVKAFDFGSWKNAKYAGTKIPTLKEFLDLCRYLSLHPYIELKTMTNTQADAVLQAVIDAGMKGRVTYISFELTSLQTIAAADPTARLGLVGHPVNATINNAFTLKNGTNEVFVDTDGTPTATKGAAAAARAKGMDLEVWTVNNAATALEHIEGGAAGITTDTLNIRDVLNTKYLG